MRKLTGGQLHNLGHMNPDYPLLSLLSSLQRNMNRLAGAQLDSAFVTMAAHILEESDLQVMTRSAAGQPQQSLQHHGKVYHLMADFACCYRLQAFCLGQALSQQQRPYLITHSPERFAVWAGYSEVKNRFFEGNSVV